MPNRSSRLKIAVAAALAIPLAPAAMPASAQTAAAAVDYGAIARRVVTESAAVRPGEVVLISGSVEERDLLEALQAEVLLAGGQPIVTVNFPRAERRAFTEVPLDYLRQEPRAQLALIQAADVFISAGSIQDPTLYADVPEERVTISRQASQPVTQALAAKRARSIDIGQTGGIPTEAYARSQRADYAAMRDMFFRSLAVPTEVIAQRGAAVSRRMQPGQTVRLRSAGGTDLSFRLAAGRTRVSTGRAADNDSGTGMAAAFLPAGDFYACVDPASAAGTVVVPAYTFRGREVRNLRLTFRGGALTGFTADEGADFVRAFFEQLDAPSKHMSLINIGLNPESRPLAGSSYLSWQMSGVPTVFLGNNDWAGCNHAAQAGLNFHLTGATLAVGGTEVVRNGELALD